MTESRTPPKFVPTLTEVAAQEMEPVFDDSLMPPAPSGQASAPTQLETESRTESFPASEPAPIEVFRLRRGLDSAALETMPSDAEIASLPTSSGWAQALPENAAVPMATAEELDPKQFQVDTDQLPDLPPPVVLPEPIAPIAPITSIAPVTPVVSHTPAAVEQGVRAPALNVAPVEGASSDAAMQAATASLVASAAATAQALEEAITRRVLRRVQETLDERLTSAVLKVVEQQTALLQSSLQLEIDTSIRDAVAAAVQQVLRAESAEQAASSAGQKDLLK